MDDLFELTLRSFVLGAGATLGMDLWAAALRRFGISSLRFELLGRWIGHLPRGRLRHDDIAKAPAVRGERWIGWCAHYAIGISFAALLLASFGLEWARTPTLGPPMFIGFVTVLAPWLVLQPAIGAGVASSKTPRPLFNATKSLVTHAVFGVGLFVTAHATVLVAP
ncbi:DUF2938 domain-containing protein [Myxococcota bacterium]|nr:DUF2938 domain-containing protein [Myxococcota bacterium]